MAFEGAGVVMIAVDGSTQAENAFKYYIANLHSDKYTLLLVHAAEPSEHRWRSTELLTDDLWDHLLDSQIPVVKEVEEKFKTMMANFKVEGRFMIMLSNKPGESICRIAEQEKCLMIVIGARGQGKVRRTILGSVSNYVVHHAHCPVAVCREQGSGFCNVCGPR